MNENREDWSLAELIADPLVGLVMKSDGVDGHSIRLLFERVAGSAGWSVEQHSRRLPIRPSGSSPAV